MRGVAGSVTVADEKLAHHLRGAMAVLVKIDLAVLHAEDAKLGRPVVDTDLRQDVVHQIRVQRVVRRKMSEIMF
jgi:hypothetical protein